MSVVPQMSAFGNSQRTDAVTEAARSAARQRAIALVKRAELAFYQGNIQKTVSLCQTANKADATYPRAYTWLGAMCEKQGKKDEARAAESLSSQLAISKGRVGVGSGF